ncbi:hypothetical protein C8J57DRAFT_1726373 [Mycena rebaudengoi]|nr:hypothetical protein C8J57DRAFT_1726373 [Mycena rebaudengoi]
MLIPCILAPVALLLNFLSAAALPVGSGGTGAGADGISIGDRGVDSGVGSGGTGAAVHGISISGRGVDSDGTDVVADVWGTGVGTDAIAIGGRDAAKPDYFEVEFEAERRGSANVVGRITYLAPDSVNKPSTGDIIWGWGGNAVGGGEVGTDGVGGSGRASDAIVIGGRDPASGKGIQLDTVSSLLMTTE